MTRINVGVLPQELCGKHLIAEHREIKRIPNQIAKGKCKLEHIPNKFCLGPGHVKFFYDKLGYLLKRYKALHEECLVRGYSVQDYSGAWEGISAELMKDWTPTIADREIVLERITERLRTMK